MHLRIYLWLSCVALAGYVRATENPLTNRVQLTDKTGRFMNEYNVVTNDEYILTVFRLTYENDEAPLDKYPVLLVHGLFQSSDRFLQQSEDKSLAFKLQDFGYDVWLANVRGNKYGRRHTSFGPETDDKAIFFNYTYEEIALNDIAATVDFILYETKFEKMHYIGYSLGGTSFLVLNSMEPEYNNKFDTAHLLAPIGYQNFFPNSDLGVVADRCDEIYGELLNHSTVEIFPYEATNRDILFSIEECLGDEAYENICNLLNITETMGIQSQGNKINETRGGSIKQLVHLAQNVRAKRFCRWDYGEKGNEEHYGTKEPPKYDLSVITVATKIIFSSNDEYVSPKDIADMATHMGNATIREVLRKSIANLNRDIEHAATSEVGRVDVANMATNIGNVATTEVSRKDVADMATDISNNTSRELGRKDVTDMATDKGNTATREVGWNDVGEKATAIGNSTRSKVRRKNTADFARYIDNGTAKEVGRKDVAEMSTEMGSSTTSESAMNSTNIDTDMDNATKKEENGRYFKHKDFIDAPDAMDLVYYHIISDLEKNSNRQAYITRQRKIKLSDSKNDTNGTSEEEQVNEKAKNMDWFWVAVVPSLILFATLIFICVVKTLDFACHFQL